MPDLDLRASDDERDRAVAQLRDASVQGRLTLEELAERTGRAHQARTRAELQAVLADLPSALASPSATDDEPERHFAALSSIERIGRWNVPQRARFTAVLSSVRLDLRSAVLPGPEIEIELISVLSSAEVLVPEGVEVVLSGGGLLSSQRLDMPASLVPGAPVVRIRTSGALGSVEVRSEPSLSDQLGDHGRQLLGDVMRRSGRRPSRSGGTRQGRIERRRTRAARRDAR